jgi:YfiH family protein
MRLRQPDEVAYYTFDILDDPRLVHAVFTRRGGVSPHPWASLNVGGLVGDERERVIENRMRSFREVGRQPGSIYDVWQVHGREVVYAKAPRPPDVPHLRADIILTDTPGVTLFMRFGDCVPILLYDPGRHVVGLAHAGWLGTVKHTAAAAIIAMHEKYGSNPVDIRAAIGPSIGAHHYEVGPEVVEQVRAAFGADASTLLHHPNGSPDRVQFDLWAANQLVLEQSGVMDIELAGHCTACRMEDWYSHRGEKGKTGRFGVLIALT